MFLLSQRIRLPANILQLLPSIFNKYPRFFSSSIYNLPVPLSVSEKDQEVVEYFEVNEYVKL